MRKNFSPGGLALALVMLAVFVFVGRLWMGPTTGIGVRGPAGPGPRDYGTPPDGVNLLYMHDPNMPTWLIGYDWSGKVRGTVRFNKEQVGTMAPDGQSFVVSAGGKGGSGTFFDNVGQPFPRQGGALEYASNVWADDSRHMCTVSLDQHTFVWALNTQLPTEAIKKVAVIARDPGAGQSSISSKSVRNEKAIRLPGRRPEGATDCPA